MYYLQKYAKDQCMKSEKDVSMENQKHISYFYDPFASDIQSRTHLLSHLYHSHILLPRYFRASQSNAAKISWSIYGVMLGTKNNGLEINHNKFVPNQLSNNEKYTISYTLLIQQRNINRWRIPTGHLFFWRILQDTFDNMELTKKFPTTGYHTFSSSWHRS